MKYNNLNVRSNNNTVNDKEVYMTSLELETLINKFRQEEGNNTKKEHKTILRDIRTEIKTLENAGFDNEYNFVLVEKGYKDKKGEWRPYYKLSKQAIMMLLNKESTIVRYKTQQYITELENRNVELSNAVTSLDDRIMSKFVEALDIMKDEIKKEIREEIKEDIKGITTKIDTVKQDRIEKIVDECKFEAFEKFVEMQNDSLTFDRKVFISFFNSYNFYYKKLGIKEFNQILKDNNLLNAENSQEMTNFAEAEGILSMEDYRTSGDCRTRKRIEITKRGMEYIIDILCRK